MIRFYGVLAPRSTLRKLAALRQKTRGVSTWALAVAVYAAENRGVTTATLFIADDPAFEPFVPVLEAIANLNGITLTETVKLGFEPDLTGPVSAADPANEGCSGR